MRIRLLDVRRILLVLALSLAVWGSMPRAHAQGADGVEISAQAGLAGRYRTGEPMAVVVTLESDTLVTGTVRLQSSFDSQSRQVPVELPAGTRRELVLSIPAPMFDPGPTPYQIEFIDSDGRTVRASPTVRAASEGLVAVLGPLASTAPETVLLDATGQTLEIVELRAERLSAPGVLGPASILVTESADLDRLDPTALEQVLDWVTTGGQLVIDDASGSVNGLPADWQPGPNGRTRAGRGMIIAGQGRLAAGQWAQLDAAPVGSNLEFFGGGPAGFEGASQSAARDAGLSSVEIGGPLALVLIYALVAGPATYMLMRSRRRTGLIWVAVPTLAVVATTAIVVTGSSAQTSTRFSHVAILETGAGPNHYFAAVGATTPRGGTVSFDIPSGAVGSLGDDMFFGGSASGRSSVLGTGGGGQLALDVPAGGYTAGRVRGPATGSDARLTVTATADGDDIRATVTNDTEWPLEEVGVFAGPYRTAKAGSLTPGESTEVSLELVTDNRDPYRPLGDGLWPNAVGWNGPPDVDGPVAYSVFAEYIVGNSMNAAPPGLVTAIGWTRDAEIPAGSGAGRTGVIGRSTVKGDGYQPAAMQIDVVHADEPQGFEQGLPTMPVILRVIPNQLPSPGERVTIALPAATSEAEIRRDGEWVPLDVSGPASDFDMRLTRTVPIEPGDCLRGVCYLRVKASFEGLGPSFPAEGVAP